MKTKYLIITCLLLLLMDVSSAQILRPGRRHPARRAIPQVQQPMLGVYGGQNFEYEQSLAGAHLWLPIGVFWNFVPGFNYHFTDETDPFEHWQFNGDLVFKPRPRGMFYFGGGFAADYRLPKVGGSMTKMGGSALTGFMFGQRLPLKVFVQARWTFMEEAELSVVGGLNLALR